MISKRNRNGRDQNCRALDRDRIADPVVRRFSADTPDVGNVAPLLARNFAVIGADLRGYGRGSCLVSTADHAPWHKTW